MEKGRRLFGRVRQRSSENSIQEGDYISDDTSYTSSSSAPPAPKPLSQLRESLHNILSMMDTTKPDGRRIEGSQTALSTEDVVRSVSENKTVASIQINAEKDVVSTNHVKEHKPLIPKLKLDKAESDNSHTNSAFACQGSDIAPSLASVPLPSLGVTQSALPLRNIIIPMDPLYQAHRQRGGADDPRMDSSVLSSQTCECESSESACECFKVLQKQTTKEGHGFNAQGRACLGPQEIHQHHDCTRNSQDENTLKRCTCEFPHPGRPCFCAPGDKLRKLDSRGLPHQTCLSEIATVDEQNSCECKFSHPGRPCVCLPAFETQERCNCELTHTGYTCNRQVEQSSSCECRLSHPGLPCFCSQGSKQQYEIPSVEDSSIDQKVHNQLICNGKNPHLGHPFANLQGNNWQGPSESEFSHQEPISINIEERQQRCTCAFPHPNRPCFYPEETKEEMSDDNQPHQGHMCNYPNRFQQGCTCACPKDYRQEMEYSSYPALNTQSAEQICTCGCVSLPQRDCRRGSENRYDTYPVEIPTMYNNVPPQNVKSRWQFFMDSMRGNGMKNDRYKFKLDPRTWRKLPKRIVFDLVNGSQSEHNIPPSNTSVRPEGKPKKPKKLLKKPKVQKINCPPTDKRERMDVYYFDHGNSGYYRTTDHQPTAITDLCIEQTDYYVTKFWANIFGTLHIAFAFVVSFILQLFRFTLYSILRPLTVGMIQHASDYFFKPLLTILFNSIMQPVLILLYNVATSLKDLCEPLATAIGFFLREVAVVLGAIRLVDVKNTTFVEGDNSGRQRSSSESISTVENVCSGDNQKACIGGGGKSTLPSSPQGMSNMQKGCSGGLFKPS